MGRVPLLHTKIGLYSKGSKGQSVGEVIMPPSLQAMPPRARCLGPFYSEPVAAHPALSPGRLGVQRSAPAESEAHASAHVEQSPGAPSKVPVVVVVVVVMVIAGSGWRGGKQSF